MEIQNNNQSKPLSEDELTQALLQRKITRDHFRFPLSVADAVRLLKAAFRAEVGYRQREYVESELINGYIERLARLLTADRGKFGIMLCGTCGNGKTTMLYAFQAAVNFLNDRGMFPERTGIRIIPAREIALKASDVKATKEIKSLPMLAIEDMGTESAEVLSYGNVFNPVDDVISFRYDRQLFTFITSNLTPKEIRERYGDRIADRFNEMLHVIVFEGKSFRN